MQYGTGIFFVVVHQLQQIVVQRDYLLGQRSKKFQLTFGKIKKIYIYLQEWKSIGLE